MKINAQVFLFAPSFRQFLGGTNPVIAKKTISIEITPTVLEKLLNYAMVSIDGINCTVRESYRAVDNSVTLRGNLPNERTVEKIKELTANGWQFEKDNCALYELTV